tara:strand:+ start:349 stop:852 length:504 start_codon:yes stop_codon:yes gene_type:complete
MTETFVDATVRDGQSSIAIISEGNNLSIRIGACKNSSLAEAIAIAKAILENKKQIIYCDCKSVVEAFQKVSIQYRNRKDPGIKKAHSCARAINQYSNTITWDESKVASLSLQDQTHLKKWKHQTITASNLLAAGYSKKQILDQLVQQGLARHIAGQVLRAAKLLIKE